MSPQSVLRGQVSRILERVLHNCQNDALSKTCWNWPGHCVFTSIPPSFQISEGKVPSPICINEKSSTLLDASPSPLMPISQSVTWSCPRQPQDISHICPLSTSLRCCLNSDLHHFLSWPLLQLLVCPGHFN